MSVVTLNLLVLKTRQLDRLRDFYAALGISFVGEQHGHGPTHFAGRAGDLVLELYPLPADSGPAEAGARLGFAVPDLDAVLRSLAEAGADMVSGPRMAPWGRRAVVRDPDGR